MKKLLLALTITVFAFGAFACPGDKNKPKDPTPDQRMVELLKVYESKEIETDEGVIRFTCKRN